jgi:ATP-dependent Lon protease
LPVGGIKEKFWRQNVQALKEILMCAVNEKDVKEIDSNFIKGIHFHFVKNMQQVLDIALQ